MSTAELASPPQAAERTGAPRGYVRPWLRLLRSELRLIFLRKRNLALMAVLAAIPVLLGIVLKISAPSGVDVMFSLSSVTSGFTIANHKGAAKGRSLRVVAGKMGCIGGRHAKR